MDSIVNLVNQINHFVWGFPMLIMLLGAGVFLSIRLRFLTLLRLPYAFQKLWHGRSASGKGEISPFQALMTAMSGTVGTGNIAGVATAIFLGGPGALFWMWVTAIMGMATSFSEAVLAVNYRDVDKRGSFHGGPMYYIKNGLGENWKWLGSLFAFFASIACIGTGSSIQANSIADVLESSFSIPPLASGIVVMVCVGAVVIGGITRIGRLAGAVVPFMTGIYILCGFIVLLLNAEQLAPTLELIVKSAFTTTAAEGGFAGANVMMAIRFGMARGVFSNEAGLGTSPIAHSSAQTNEPVQQGLIAMLGTFLDTVVVCTITGLAIISSGVWNNGESGASLTAMAFEAALPNLGNYIIAIGLAVFAFTTTISWAYYGERSIGYLFGNKSVLAYRFVYVLIIPIGATMNLNLMWLIADTLNALMAIPNLIALFILSPVVVKLAREYFSRQRK